MTSVASTGVDSTTSNVNLNIKISVTALSMRVSQGAEQLEISNPRAGNLEETSPVQ